MEEDKFFLRTGTRGDLPVAVWSASAIFSSFFFFFFSCWHYHPVWSTSASVSQPNLKQYSLLIVKRSVILQLFLLRPLVGRDHYHRPWYSKWSPDPNPHNETLEERGDSSEEWQHPKFHHPTYPYTQKPALQTSDIGHRSLYPQPAAGIAASKMTISLDNMFFHPIETAQNVDCRPWATRP
jgi:hypothetical protein